MEKKNDDASAIKDVKKYPGAAVDAADGGRVDQTEVKERTAVLDDNPRDNDMNEIDDF